MLVGEVRIATASSGSSCTLSGASQCVWAVAKRSK
jgi:hypothetical protein